MNKYTDNISGNCASVFFENNPQSREYVEFTSGEELLVYQERSQGMLHLLFLDIEMSGLN